MKPLDDIIAAAKSNPCHIVLSEGEDLRIIDGAIRAVGDGIAHITLLGNEARILSRGCSAEDVYHMIAVTGVQARANEAAVPVASSSSRNQQWRRHCATAIARGKSGARYRPR